MTITIQDLDNLKKHCDELSSLIKEIKFAYNPQNIERKLFVSRRDYEESLKIKNECPQDFYYFRFFDVFAQIVFCRKTKKYQIYLDGFYSDVLNKFPRVQRSDKSFEISEDFDKTLFVFQDVVNDIISNKVLQNGLF